MRHFQFTFRLFARASLLIGFACLPLSASVAQRVQPDTHGNRASASWWSFKPPVKPRLPVIVGGTGRTVRNPARQSHSDARQPKNPIDRFLLSALQQKNL